MRYGETPRARPRHNRHGPLTPPSHNRTFFEIMQAAIPHMRGLRGRSKTTPDFESSVAYRRWKLPISRALLMTGEHAPPTKTDAHDRPFEE